MSYTLGPAYHKFAYNEDPSTTSLFLCIKIITSNIKTFGYYGEFLLHLSIRWKRDPIYVKRIFPSQLTERVDGKINS